MLSTALTLLSLGLAGAQPGDDCSSKTARLASNATVTSDQDIVETAMAEGSFGTLAAALQAAELVDALKGKGPFTVFAPTDAAFAALPKGTLENLLEPGNKATLQAILGYHVVAGAIPAADVIGLGGVTTLNGQRLDIRVSDDGVEIDGAKVTRTDIHCANGIIHVIDAVLLPSAKDVVTTAVEAGQFQTLAAALRAAGLVEALQAKGPFTVFAPTDEAFAALPAGTLESLLQPENKAKLIAILKLHVVPGRVFSDAAAKGATVETLQGSKLTTRAKDGRVFVKNARVLSADLDASNGVIHVLDAVLLPD